MTGKEFKQFAELLPDDCTVFYENDYSRVAPVDPAKLSAVIKPVLKVNELIETQ